MTYYRNILAILGTIALALLASCKSGADKEGSKKAVIGFVQGGASSDWRKAHTDSVKEEAAQRGYELKFVDGQGKQENQIQGISSLILQRVDAIILAPIVETGWDNVLKKAQQAGIPVLILDRSIKTDDDSLFEGYIGADTYEEARKAAKWLIAKTEGKAKVVELQGAPGASPTINRYKGFRDVAKDHPGIEIIASQSGDFRRSKGKEVTEALLKKHGDEIEVIYAHNDDMAIGAIQAIEEAGKKPGADIILVSIDGVKSAFEAMVAGKLNCSVECNPLQGPAAFDAIEKILAGETIPKVTMVKDEVFDQSVAKDVIDSRKY
jgi:simple sugar transport system substrate-binding protein